MFITPLTENTKANIRRSTTKALLRMRSLVGNAIFSTVKPLPKSLTTTMRKIADATGKMAAV